MLLSDHGRRRRLLIALLVVTIAIFVIVGYWIFTQGPGGRLLSPPGSTVAQFSGAGDQATNSFEVRQGWRIRWESAGQRFAMAIRGERGLGTVMDISEPASGVTSPANAGTFYLEITADGSWSVTVEQGE